MLLGILAVNDATSRLMKDNGITEKDLMASIKQLRQGKVDKDSEIEVDVKNGKLVFENKEQ